MDDDRIEDIRARHEMGPRAMTPLTGYAEVHTDRAFLLAEVERLREENERLNKDLLAQNACCDGAAAQDAHVRREREEHKAEVERLRAEIVRLRAALEGKP